MTISTLYLFTLSACEKIYCSYLNEVIVFAGHILQVKWFTVFMVITHWHECERSFSLYKKHISFLFGSSVEMLIKQMTFFGL